LPQRQQRGRHFSLKRKQLATILCRASTKHYKMKKSINKMMEDRKAETDEANIDSNQLPFPLPFPLLYTVYGYF